MSTVPAQPYEPNPELFFRLTSKSEFPAGKKAYPGPQGSLSFTLPHVGIVSEIRLVFEGTVAGAATGVEDALWAYHMVKRIKLSGPGQTDIMAASGGFFHVLRFVKNPALQRNSEFYATTPDENGAFRVVWVIPVAADPVSLAGAIWTQSQTQQITVDIETATYAEIGITGGAPAITGNFSIFETVFEVPFHPSQPNVIVVPDLSRTHGIVQRPQAILAAGAETVAPLSRQQATLMRLFAYFDKGHATGIRTPFDFTATTVEVEKIIARYGARQTPLEYDPAWLLAAKNSEHYGSALPKGWVVIDLVKENGPRDTWQLPGVSDPELVAMIRAGTALAANSRIELVQEMLYLNK